MLRACLSVSYVYEYTYVHAWVHVCLSLKFWQSNGTQTRWSSAERDKEGEPGERRGFRSLSGSRRERAGFLTSALKVSMETFSSYCLAFCESVPGRGCKSHFLTTSPSFCPSPTLVIFSFVLFRTYTWLFVCWELVTSSTRCPWNSDSLGRSPVSPSEARKLFLLSRPEHGLRARPTTQKCTRGAGIAEEGAGPARAWSLYCRCSGEPRGKVQGV